jgi:hypothetical protein
MRRCPTCTDAAELDKRRREQPAEGPGLAQIVTVRDIGEEAQISHLELTDQARAIAGHELVFTAIH